MNTFNYCYENFRRFGIKRLLYDLTYKFLQRICSYSRDQGMILTMSSIDPAFLKPNNGFEYRFLTATELREYAKDPCNHLDITFIEKALANKDKCYAIIDQENLAAYGWYATKDTAISDDLVVCFSKSWVYMYNGFTKPKYRGQRLHAFGKGKALEAFSKRGAKGLISCVAVNNFRSIRSNNLLGCGNFGKVTALKILGKFRIKTQKACHKYGFNYIPKR